MSTELIGPFVEEWRVVVDGYTVPKLSAIPLTGAKDGRLSVCLDHRFIVECDRDELNRWAWLIGNAMAIGAGFSCLGKNSRRVNEFCVEMNGIDTPLPPIPEEEGGQP